MTRLARLPLVVLLGSALAATGLCTSLSAGAATSCPVANAPEHGARCDHESGGEGCPEAPASPTCRTCDDAVAFLLRGKTADGDAPGASFAHVSTLAPRPAAVLRRATTSLHLSSISSSPPLHLLNVTFRN